MHSAIALNTPVALLIFNRPDLTARVLDAMRIARPGMLFVFADGPRDSRDVDRCTQARAVIDTVDWECRVFKHYSDRNLGCRNGVARGISWVFSHVEEAIILEDDCLPGASFFFWCQDLLARYRDDTRIMEIGGCNFQFGRVRTDYSYYFSKYPHTWGWATWRRAWRHFDVEISLWPALKEKRIIELLCDNSAEADYWTRIFDDLYEGRLDTWDYQWLLALWSQSGLSAVPEKNLVQNIGFRDDATHTKTPGHFLAEQGADDLWSIRHPPLVFRHREADQFMFETTFQDKQPSVIRM